MIDTPAELFDRYCTISDDRDRLHFALQNPRLLWSRTVRALAEKHAPENSQRSGFGKLMDATTRLFGGAKAPPIDRLVELDRLRQQLLLGHDGWKMGEGPIERLLASPAPLMPLLETCRSDAFLAIVAPPYLRTVAYHGADLAATEHWQEGVRLCACAADAALAFDPDQALDNDLAEVVLATIQAATVAQRYQLDASIFTWALNVAMTALDRAERANDRAQVGKLCQNVGALFSDIWTVPGRLDDGEPVRLEDWLARPHSGAHFFDWSGKDAYIPTPAECLDAALAWFRRALPYRHGAAQGLTFKAIVQTQEFREVVFTERVDDDELRRFAGLAATLLAKHEHAEAHLLVIENVRERRGWPPLVVDAPLSTADEQLLRLIDTGHESSSDTVELRVESHAAAVADLDRIFRFGLPWTLYLRNFAYANAIRMLGEVIKTETEDGLHLVVPQITYSMVDHKILELSQEGVITVSDPALSIDHRSMTMPMLSLRNDAWLQIVGALVERSDRVAMLLDELSPGVVDELNMLCDLGVTSKTLIILGHAYRERRAVLPASILENFPHIVDWIDFSYNENHHDMRYKAHRIVQPWLSRYVRGDAQPIIRAWLEQ